jgi:glycerol uptake facilitator-like aquaporin
MSDTKVANKSLMQESVADMVGSALFMWVVLAATSNIVVAAGLFVIISVFANQANCTINPMLTTGQLINGQITRKVWFHHVVFQLIGAVIGVALYCWVNNKRINWFGADCKFDKADKSSSSSSSSTSN